MTLSSFWILEGAGRQRQYRTERKRVSTGKAKEGLQRGGHLSDAVGDEPNHEDPREDLSPRYDHGRPHDSWEQKQRAAERTALGHTGPPLIRNIPMAQCPTCKTGDIKDEYLFADAVEQK